MSGDFEIDIIKRLKKKYPQFDLNIDPNGAWSFDESVKLCLDSKEYLSYFEDPASGEFGHSGREIMAELKMKTGVRIATNMIATDWRQLYHSISQKSIDIVLADPHFWTMSGSIRCSQVLNDFNMIWGSHSNNHFDISLAMYVQTAAAALGDITVMDTHWIWQDGQDLCDDSYKIIDGNISLRENRPGLGVELNMEKVKKANELYKSLDKKYIKRDDSIAMQYLFKDWKYDSKKPCMVR